MKRRIHFVGSLPAPLAGRPRQAMEWILDRAGGQPLTALPCDADPDWIIGYLRDLRTRTDAFDFTHCGDDYADYNHMPAGRIRPGVRLDPEHLTMNRVHTISSMVGEYATLHQQRPDLAGAKIQISQPHSLDLALFALGGQAVQDGLPIRHALRHASAITTALAHVPVFTEAVTDEIALLIKSYGAMLHWQIESPVALLSMVKAADLHAASALAVPVAAQLAGVFTRLHHIGAHTSLHLCYGDYRHTALLPPRSLAPRSRNTQRPRTPAAPPRYTTAGRAHPVRPRRPTSTPGSALLHRVASPGSGLGTDRRSGIAAEPDRQHDQPAPIRTRGEPARVRGRHRMRSGTLHPGPSRQGRRRHRSDRRILRSLAATGR
ncbi:hypothetical protein [Nocardia brasiliensis]|uniref:hypothetical protein n=1 Tax=Nocardia brasiliensis TaxID=37326 RepID=UPI002457789E|nr:hypothetical protein [Nocardia brasiliensis]